jgi:hypothetical membrane protein
VVLVQLVVAARWEIDFDPTRNTISDLGAVGCGTIDAAGGPVEVCSPWHAGMNVTFVVIGTLLALGGLLVAPALTRRTTSGVRWAALVAAGLLTVAGISSAAVGLVPLDVDPELHTMVAAPLFVAQPVALLLVGGLAVRAGRRRWGGLLLGLGVLAAAGGIAFGVTLVAGEVGGLYERVSLWPCHLGVAALGWGVARSARGSGAPSVWEDAA